MVSLTQNRLIDELGKVFIIAYKESTQLLEQALKQEGFDYEVLRQETKEEYQQFSPSYRCLLNHKRAWQEARQQSKPTLIIEADFVPVAEFGKLFIPYNSSQSDVGVAWLYTCAPQVYSVSQEGYAQGYSASTVAYIVTAKAAQCLLELAQEIKEKVGPTAYSSWDSNIDAFLRNRGLKNCIPFRNYGEHGGLPNLEHHRHGLGRSHRADVLFGKLAFMPLYAINNNQLQLNFLGIRFSARLKGIFRLLTGRFLRWPILQGSTVPWRLLWFSISRQLTLY